MLAARTLLALVVAATTARADDTSMFVTFGGTIGVGTTVDGETSFGDDYDPEGVLAGRVTASWEPPPLPYKEPRGYRLAGAVIPEVTLGYLRVADHRTGDPDGNTDAFVTIGGRLEARLSQRRMGLLRVSARGGVYLAGRVGLLTDADRTPVLEVAVGEHLFLGDRVRVGGEVGMLRFFGEDYAFVVRDLAARAPWRDGNGQYLSFHATVFVGWRL